MTVARTARIGDPAAFGKVAVLMGGRSSEREISLLTGDAVHSALLRRGVDAHKVDPAVNFPAVLLEGAFDRVWLALHGRGGEDGTIQGLMDCIGMPYTGSGVLGSAISMDKLRTKRLLAGVGLPSPPYRMIDARTESASMLADLGLPLIVKPACEGSSIGMTKVERAEDLSLAVASAARYEGEIFAERWIDGAEYTAAILQGEALPLIRIEARGIFYDYQAKYFSDETRYHCPCGLPAAAERRIAELALAAFDAVGAGGWGRVDFMVDSKGTPFILEINTIPGMTGHSLVPMAAAAAGIGFDELVWRILETSFMRVDRREAGGVA
jgi:D-alanine-D-alanine ligase